MRNLHLADGQEHAVAEWEKAGRSGAARGPPSRRQRTRTTPSGANYARRARRHPASHRWARRPSWRTSPTRSGPRLVATAGTCVPSSGTPTREGSEAAALTDLENGATSLRLQVGASGIELATSPRCSGACCSTWHPSSSTHLLTRWLRPAPSPTLDEGPDLAPGTNLGGDPVGARPRGFETLAGAPHIDHRGGARGGAC